MSKEKIKRIEDLGKIGLIDHLTKGIKVSHSSTIAGIGDDAAVLDHNNKCVLVSTDLLTEGIHFNLVYTPLKHLGYKAVVINLSDIYAMNAQAKQITVSLALSNKFSVEMIDDLYEGIKMACKHYNIDLIGGDTTSSLTGLTISITAIGEAEKKNITYRKGAKINDLICVSGDLGAAYMGLQLLERERKLFLENSSFQPDLSGKDYILSRQLKPEARKDIIDLLNEKSILPSSMIDISDGLSSELMHICKASETGCSIFQDKIPIDTETAAMANEFNIDPLTCAFNGGDDHELLFTISQEDYDKLKDSNKISIIGHITDKSEGINMITSDGRAIPLRAQGWVKEE